METPTVIQGRLFTAEDLALVLELRKKAPAWSQYRLSRELAEQWDWRNGKGQLKDIACRSLLRKLEAKGLIDLPARRCVSPNCFRHEPARPVAHDTIPIIEPLSSLQPLQWLDTSSEPTSGLFRWLLASHHYLGYRQPVGENMAYLAADRHGRPLACLLFGSAAWSCAARDHQVGWSARLRRQRLHLLTNNHRFVVLPWVRAPHLASHLLGKVTKRLSQDWQSKYGHPILLVETFVDPSRFQGICYRAANWLRLGQTTGRTRNDPWNRISTSVKDVYAYPLHAQALEKLRDAP